MNESQAPDSPPEDEKLGSSPAEQVIALFGGIRPMAAKLSVPVTTVQGWKKRGHIPANRHDAILASATALGLNLEASLLAQAGIEREPSTASLSSAEPPPREEAENDRPTVSPPRAEVGIEEPVPRPKVEPAIAKEPEAATKELPGRERPTARGLAQSPPPVRRGGFAAGLAVFLALCALGAAVTQPLWSPVLLQALGRGESSLDGDLDASAALRQELVAVRSELDSLKRTPMASVSDEGTAAFVERLTAVEARQQASGESAGAALASVQTRLDNIENRTAALVSQAQTLAADLPAQVSAQRETLAQLAQQMLQTRLELQSLRREVQGNSLPQLQAQARALILLQLRAALQTAAPFQAELQSAVQQSAADPALQERLASVFAGLEPIAPRGAPTVPQLAAELPPLARQAAESERARADAGFWERVLARLSAVVSIRVTPVEGVASDASRLSLSQALAQAEAVLRRDDLAAAIEVTAAQQNLPAPVAAWLTRARDRQSVDEAQAEIGRAVVQTLPRPRPEAAITSPSAPPPAPVPAPSTPSAETPLPESPSVAAPPQEPAQEPAQDAVPEPATPPARLDLPPMIGSP